MFSSETTFDEMRKALIEKNIALNCGYESKEIDYEYLFDKWSSLPKASGLSNEIDEYVGDDGESLAVEFNLNITHLIGVYLSAFANLTLAARLRYTMILLYCSDPKRCLENDDVTIQDLCFLYSAKLVELPDSRMVITTKEGMQFLHRFFVTDNLKQEFK